MLLCVKRAHQSRISALALLSSACDAMNEQVDLAQCWGDAYRNLAVAPASYPQAVVVRLQLPGVTSAAGVELDVGPRSLCVVVPKKWVAHCVCLYLQSKKEVQPRMRWWK